MAGARSYCAKCQAIQPVPSPDALNPHVVHPPVLAAEAEVPAFATLQNDRSSKKCN